MADEQTVDTDIQEKAPDVRADIAAAHRSKRRERITEEAPTVGLSPDQVLARESELDGRPAPAAAPAAAPADAPADVPADVPADAPAAAPTDTPAAAAAAPTDMETIIVDGVEQQISRDELIAKGREAAQKLFTGDKRLEEAAVARKQNEQDAAKIQAAAAKIREMEDARAKEANDRAQEQSQESAKERAEKLVQAFYSGDEDAAIAAATEILQASAPPASVDSDKLTINPDELASTVADRAQHQLDVRAARVAFSSAFPELARTQQTLDLADQHLTEVLKEDGSLSLKDASLIAGQRVRDQLGITVTDTDGADTGAQPSRRDRRNRALEHSAPSAASARAASPEEKPRMTRKDIIASMGKARAG